MTASITKRCYFCEKEHKFPITIIDTHHKFRRVLGGSDDTENLIQLCRDCHRMFESETDPTYMTVYHSRNRNNGRIIINLKHQTHEKLILIAKYGDSMDSVINRVADFYIKANKLEDPPS